MTKIIKNSEGVESKNEFQLESFAEYCIGHPDERFYQALRNWSGNKFILIAEDFNGSEYTGIKDTFYEG